MSLRNLFGTVKQVFKESFTPRDITPTLTLLDFKNNHELDKVITRCDQELGGYSTVNLDIARDRDNKFAHFHGNLNLDTPSNNPKVMYSGWAMFRTKHKNAYQHKLFYLSDYFANFRWDFSPYQCMVLKCKIEPTQSFTPSNSKDGSRLRSFFVNIQTDSASQTDLFQHRLFFQKPGQWETIVINLDDFVLTNRGRVLSQISGEMERERIKSIGIGITDGIYGPYSLYIDSIKVMYGDDLLQSLKEARSSSNENSK